MFYKNFKKQKKIEVKTKDGIQPREGANERDLEQENWGWKMKEAGKVRKLWSKRAEFAETHNDMGAYFRDRERERGERNKKFVCLERKRERKREKRKKRASAIGR